jgi:ATP synthase protein I
LIPTQKGPDDKKRLAEYSTIGIMFPVSIAVGLAIGYFLDSLFNTYHYLTMIFLLYGIAAGFVNLYRVVKRNEKRK